MSARSAHVLWVVAAATALAGTLVAAPQQPRSGAPVAKIGTATIAGVVVDDQATPRPLRRAVVTVMGTELGLGRSAISDDEGRFSIANLPAGRVTITASKRGYVDGAYGARRAGRAGTPVEVRDGEMFSATVTLVRAAVLTGTIRDTRGNVVPGLRVFSLAAKKPSPPPVTARGGSATVGAITDDRGIYRIYDVTPGEYVIAATPTETINGEIARRSATETDALLARLRQRTATTGPPPPPAARPVPTASSVLAPVYFAGASTLTRATRVTVGPGEVRDGLDFIVSSVPMTTIEGAIVAEGPLPASVQMSILPTDTLRFFALGGGNPELIQPPGNDGRFKYISIVPGHYVITARANVTAPAAQAGGRGGSGAIDSVFLEGRQGGGNRPETMYAIEEFDVTGPPVVGLTLRLQRGSRFSGKVVVDAGSPALDLANVRVALRPPPSGSASYGGTLIGTTFNQTPPVALGPDGSFEIVGLPPGPYSLEVTAPGAPGETWWCRAAVARGVDLLDTGVTLKLGEDLMDVALSLTTQHSEIAGTLQSAGGLPAPDYFVIVMPADSSLWTAGSRRLRMARPSTDGRFRVADLPAGDYLLVATTDVDPDEWQTTAFLRAIAASGVRIAIGQGERKTQDLRIGGR